LILDEEELALISQALHFLGEKQQNPPPALPARASHERRASLLAAGWRGVPPRAIQGDYGGGFVPSAGASVKPQMCDYEGPVYDYVHEALRNLACRHDLSCPRENALVYMSAPFENSATILFV